MRIQDAVDFAVLKAYCGPDNIWLMAIQAYVLKSLTLLSECESYLSKQAERTAEYMELEMKVHCFLSHHIKGE